MVVATSFLLGMAMVVAMAVTHIADIVLLLDLLIDIASATAIVTASTTATAITSHCHYQYHADTFRFGKHLVHKMKQSTANSMPYPARITFP